jgi:hypothetical protein
MATHNHMLSGRVRQIELNEEGHNLHGDLCLTDSWDEARVTGEFAWLNGKTNGNKFTLDVVVADEKVGTLNYEKLPHPVRGLTGYGQLKLGKAKPQMVAVFENIDHRVSIDDEGKPTSVAVKSHRFNVMSAEEVARYIPTKPTNIGELM